MITNDTDIQTKDWALAAFLNSRGKRYKIVPHLLSDGKVEVQFIFTKSAEVERLVDEFKNDQSLHAFLKASHEVRDDMMTMVRTINGNKKPSPLRPKSSLAPKDTRRYQW